MEPWSCEDLAEDCWREIDQICDEMHWDGGLNTEQLFNYLKRIAFERKIELIDSATFSYEDFFYNWYRNCERGLS